MNYSEQIHLAIYGSLPADMQSLLSQPQRVTFEATTKPTTKDDAIIVMGVLSHNLNTLFAGLFSKISVAELMLFAAGMNPINEGMLLSSLALYNSNFDFDYSTQITPITGEDETGAPIETGKTVTVTPTATGGDVTVFVLSIPAISLNRKASAGETISFDADSDMTALSGKISATMKDGVTVEKDFYTDLSGGGGGTSGGGGASGGW